MLAGRVDFEATPVALSRIAMLCEDADALSSTETSGLEELAARYAEFTPGNELEAELVGQVRAAIASWQGE